MVTVLSKCVLPRREERSELDGRRSVAVNGRSKTQYRWARPFQPVSMFQVTMHPFFRVLEIGPWNFQEARKQTGGRYMGLHFFGSLNHEIDGTAAIHPLLRVFGTGSRSMTRGWS